MTIFRRNLIGTAILLQLFTVAKVCNAGNSFSYADDEHHGGGYEFIVHVYYEDIYSILVFLFTAYAAGLVTKAMGMPALVGEIVTGFLLGPPLADYVPFSDALVLIGEIGLIFLLIEAGIELDVTQLRQTGTRALGIAITGSALPIAAGIALVMAVDRDFGFKGALAVGFAFAPTSLGVASSALSSGKVADTSVGQLIMAACVLSDIIGLVLLSMFQVLVKDDPKMIEYFTPIISSFGLLIILGLLAIKYLAPLIQNKFLTMFPKDYRNMAMFGLLFAMCMGYLPLMYYTKASYLAGAFLVGATFSLIDGAHKQFIHSTQSIMEWLLRIFFAATIGFQVPVEMFSQTYVICMGLAFWGTCVLIKLFVAFFVPKFEDSDNAAFNPYTRDLFITGLSMTCRGELNFIIAAFALNEGVIDPKMYAAVVFAVLLSAITSPFALLKCIKYFKTLQEKRLKETDPTKKQHRDGTMPLHLHIHLETKGAWSLLDRLQTEMKSLDLIIEDYRTGHARGLDPVIVNDFYVRDGKTRIKINTVESERKLHQSTNNISKRSLQSMNSDKDVTSPEDRAASLSLLEEEKVVVAEKLKEDDAIMDRERKIMITLRRKLSDLQIIALTVNQWTPWDWSRALDAMSLRRGNGEDLSEEFFQNLFHVADTDGSGDVDEDELFKVLDDAGMKLTKEGLDALVASVDEDGDGKISRAEWNQAIAQYFEMRKRRNVTEVSIEDTSDLEVAVSFPVNNVSDENFNPNSGEHNL